MKLIVDIDDSMYDAIQKTEFYINGMRSGKTFLQKLIATIRNGTPLPKDHGRLIDADAFIEKMKDASKRQKYKEVLIDDYLTVDDVFKAIIESLQNEGLANGDAPTIIETDTERSY